MEKPETGIRNGSYRRLSREYIEIFHEMLRHANLGLPRAEFMSRMAGMLVDFSGSDSVEVRKTESGKLLCVDIKRSEGRKAQIDVIPKVIDESGEIVPCVDLESDFEQICRDIFLRRFDPELPYYTKKGSFFIGNANDPLELSSLTCKWAGGRTISIKGEFISLAVVAFRIDSSDSALLIFRSKDIDCFSEKDVEAFEEIAQMLAIASSHRRAQEALRERVKELTCLYEIARVAAKPNISLDRIATEVLELLPPGWFYPVIATAQIVIDDKAYTMPDYSDGLQRLSANIVVDGKIRGVVEVAYTRKMPELDEGPFLKEERNLINAIATELAAIIERQHIQEQQRQLQEQLRHADRLATIGQLAAGVAHELNEPLGSVLGFAQLAKRGIDDPVRAIRDIEKIESASLHAREVVKKLMVFARQTPQQKTAVNLSQVVEEGLYFLESRCAKAGIKLTQNLASDLPEITADRSQLYQVLVNLVVNAIQAMPDGGTIDIETGRKDQSVVLTVSDSGVGIEEEILEKIFVPFFTTKDIDEGTGLGLAVVHGIVTAHKGTVIVKSIMGEGTIFTVSLPLDIMEKTGSESETESE
jgi:signal transduction histidine kinase